MKAWAREYIGSLAMIATGIFYFLPLGIYGALKEGTSFNEGVLFVTTPILILVVPGIGLIFSQRNNSKRIEKEMQERNELEKEKKKREQLSS